METAAPTRYLQPTPLVARSERPAIALTAKSSVRFRSWTVLRRCVGLLLGNLILRCLGPSGLRRRQERIIACLLELGMLWIRVAQTLVLHRGTLATPFGRRLLDLSDHGGATPFEEIRPIVEAALGRSLESVFDSFEPRPFAATTVSQIHRARLLREKRWVAVKVQQPRAEALFTRDLRLLRNLVIAAKTLGILQGMRWDDLYHELREITVRELNYSYEANALRTLGVNLAGQPVRVPSVYRSYSNHRVLVMEYVTGALLADCIRMQARDPQRLARWLEANHIRMETVAARLFEATYRQVFEHNFFHGDMNSRNIVLLRNSHIAFVECRSAGSLEVESLDKQRLLLESWSNCEYTTAAEIYFLLSSRLPRVDLNTVKEQLVRIWRTWEARAHISGLPYEQKSMTHMLGDVNRLVGDSGFAALWSFSRLIGTWAHMDNALAFLDPGFNPLPPMRRYFNAARRRQAADNLSRLPSRLASALVALHQIPDRVATTALFEEILMRRKAQVIQGSASKLDAIVAAGFSFVALVLSLAAVFLAITGLTQHRVIEGVAILGPQLTGLAGRVPHLAPGIWALLLGGMAGTIVLCRIQRQRFSRKEPGRGAGVRARQV